MIPGEPPSPVEPTPAEAGIADADRIRTAVLACAEVAGLSPGAFGSYLPGRRVPGIQIDDDLIEVHLVVRYGQPLVDIAEQVGHALAPMLAGRRLQVAVEDILLPGESLGDQPDAEAGLDGTSVS